MKIKTIAVILILVFAVLLESCLAGATGQKGRNSVPVYVKQTPAPTNQQTFAYEQTSWPSNPNVAAVPLTEWPGHNPSQGWYQAPAQDRVYNKDTYEAEQYQRQLTAAQYERAIYDTRYGGYGGYGGYYNGYGGYYSHSYGYPSYYGSYYSSYPYPYYTPGVVVGFGVGVRYHNHHHRRCR